ncbi:hypothetical protein I551_8466 [Mycobacterium ulcerans str. Harvey]|uniref:Uncharacterized protein n=1 Tax=Mycobacterium ulcerans str. Harvey TaxID=1299332 RepID=A0ABN0RAY9_MYCUL|nr:hypothetical protein I551_8466 [Mycobacterium ulcerans str. Harvey]
MRCRQLPHPKGFSYSQLQLSGGNTMDLYNLHANTGGGVLAQGSGVVD